MRFVLASASPARLSTLRRAGVDPEVVVSGVDEELIVADTPAELSTELARLKCRAVAVSHRDALVLGCDSVLEFDGEILGKPYEPEVARRRWYAMRGNVGVLHTGHCLRLGDEEVVRHAATRVHFAYVTDEEIDAYVASGEPLQVAGAFTIDGLGAAFVTRIEGDHHNVVGVSVPVVREMMRDLGQEWTSLWR
ncbi:septum formation inhibitor Maf [Aeromicrobium sp. 636]|uniref:Nucleoside triphosphate pyrophosphatase n=1 Tax=Aeromicrobium senzhongii TaxID=2663859 RepID=A0A8I0EVT3_9ACTN|nr:MULTISPECIES: nucleoside triphosphate pyrophosphatase [Aeromicrobium]MBC9226257.1 septum formation inhibitor Maf [Aeromicrobium senzhongii]MCQ3998363.1 septum formation inhibitor Maf [Aeromicrobium sp. 636]